MNKLAEILGKRIRNYRLRQNLTQEKLAELAGCHPTYIGQVERGEKNITVENIYKISKAVDVTLSELFFKIELNNESLENENKNIPLLCYEYMLNKPKAEQYQLYQIILHLEKYKNL